MFNHLHLQVAWFLGNILTLAGIFSTVAEILRWRSTEIDHDSIDHHRLLQCSTCVYGVFYHMCIFKLLDPEKNMLMLVISVSRFGSSCSHYKIQGNINAKINFGHNFWLEGPTDLRSTLLSYIFYALFRNTPLGYVHHTNPNNQIAKYPNIWLRTINVGYPWKEHEKCSSVFLA